MQCNLERSLDCGFTWEIIVRCATEEYISTSDNRPGLINLMMLEAS